MCSRLGSWCLSSWYVPTNFILKFDQQFLFKTSRVATVNDYQTHMASCFLVAPTSLHLSIAEASLHSIPSLRPTFSSVISRLEAVRANAVDEQQYFQRVVERMAIDDVRRSEVDGYEGSSYTSFVGGAEEGPSYRFLEEESSSPIALTKKRARW